MWRVWKILMATAFFTLAVLSSPSQNEAKTFPDLPNTQFGYEEVMKLLEQGIITGMPDGTFQPTKEVSRADTAVMLHRALTLEVPKNISNFTDVPAGIYYAEAALATKHAGIFRGYPNGTFGPTDRLTREQMATVIVRAYGLKPIEGIQVNLHDLQTVSHSHVEDVKILFQHGITKGKEGGIFDPKGPVTRTDFSVFLQRSVEKYPVPPRQQQEEEKPSEESENLEEQEEQEQKESEGGAPPAAGGGAPTIPTPTEPNQEVALDVISSTISTATGDVTATINRSVPGQLTLHYNLRDRGTIESGQINVSKDSTITVIATPDPDGRGVGRTDTFTAGNNTMGFVDTLSNPDNQAEINRARKLGLTLFTDAELTDEDGNTILLIMNFRF